jgi:hypothetical protein
MSRLSERTRSVASTVLVIGAAVLLLVGTLAVYTRTQVIARDAFADRAVAALDRDAVRHAVGREVVTGLLDRGSTDLVGARPLLQTVVDAVIRTDAFRRVLRLAAIEANRVFFDRRGSRVTLDLSDAAEVVRFAARSVSPRVAREIPADLQPGLLSLQRRDFAAETLRVADQVRFLALVLPPLALLALVLAVALAPDRRLAVVRSGAAVAAAGVLLAGALLIARARMLAGVEGGDALTDAEMRAAVAGLLSAFFGDLLIWALVLVLGGVVVAAAAASLDREAQEAPAIRLGRVLLRRPASPWLRGLRGLAAIVAGVAVALEPLVALQVAAIIAGASLVFVGIGELMLLLPRRGAAGRREPAGRRALVAAGAVGALAVTGVLAFAVVVTQRDDAPGRPAAAAAGVRNCNGAIALCELRLNEVVFAGTHNSFSAADSPGWSITNQRRTIPRQLKDGIRLLLLDAHWGVSDGREVRTDFRAEGRSRNRVAESLPPGTLRAAQRLAGRAGLGAQGGKRDVWLCHTVCELGATRMVDVLRDLGAFLAANRGEVVILFIEPYVPPAAIAKTFRQAGLDRSVATLPRGEPLPTLGELVRTDRRVVVLTEKDADGSVSWYLDGFAFVQDTPLRAKTPGQLRCRRYRGTPDSPLLMLNQWADVFPPRLSANPPFQRERTLLGRAHRCARQRGLPVNLIAVDFYDQGDLLEVVDELNGEQIREVRRQRRLAGAG